MYVTKHIDWLSCNMPTTSDMYSVLPAANFKRDGKGKHGFATRFIDTGSGVVMEADSTSEPEIVLLTFSGDALQNLRRGGTMAEDTRVKRIFLEGGKASRIDLTINVHEGKITPRFVQSAMKSGRVKVKANVSRFIEGKNGDIAGDTFYIGSPTADRQFRCYDKGAELGIINGSAWVRLELELRRLRANAAYISCATNGIAETVSGHMADFMQWPNPEYTAAIDGPSVPPVAIARKDTNRQRWLLGQVSQALAHEMSLDDEFANRFWQAVLEERRKLGST